MRKTLLIVLFSALAISLKAGHRNSELNLRIHDQSQFTATLDRISYDMPSNVIRFDNVAAGRHHLQATKVRYNRRGRIIHKEIVFDGYIEIPASSKVNAVIHRFHSFKILEVIPLVPIAPPSMVYSPYLQTGTICSFAMSDRDFYLLVHTIESRSFDRSRLNIALHAVRNNYVSTAQVIVLMELMTFESTKLTLAKEAYHMTIDKQIYYAVYGQFTFQSSINNLNQFIGWG